MTRSLRNGLILAVVHVALVGSLAAKLAVDRTSYPRVWARTLPVDPDLPIRGRYVRLRVEASIVDNGSLPTAEALEQQERNGILPMERVTLHVENETLVARVAPPGTGHLARMRARDGRLMAELNTPVAFFIPEHVPDPSQRAQGEELWVELTVPPTGPPRPIQLGVRAGGARTPLELR